MATIRSLAKKLSSLVLDTNLTTIGMNLLNWVIAPIIIFTLLTMSFSTYQKYKRHSYCEKRGVSQSQCDYFIEYGD